MPKCHCNITPSLTLTTANVTIVERTEIAFANEANINTPNFLDFGAVTSLNELGLAPVGDSVTIPAGDYEVLPVLSADSNAQRTNIFLDLFLAGVLTETRYQPMYGRSASGHEETGATTLFTFSVAAPTTLQIRSRQEGSTGDIDLDGANSSITIKRFRTQSVITGITGTNINIS